MTVIPFPERQTPYFADVQAVIDFSQSPQNVKLLDENHKLELIALLMGSGDCSNAEGLQALANLMGQHR